MYCTFDNWRSRGYIPHNIDADRIQSITIRLHDSVPDHVIQQWQLELHFIKGLPAGDPRQVAIRDRMEKYADKGHGACWLANPIMGQIVEVTILHDDAEKYHVIAWCIMPNHVHAIIELLGNYQLEQMLQSWKSVSAHRANKILHREGRFWFREYFDRYIRDDDHLYDAINYVENNPVKAGLVPSKELWQWSSVSREHWAED